MSISTDVSIYLAMCDIMTWLLRLDESHDSMAPGFYAWGIVGVRDGLGQTSPRLSLLSRLEFEGCIWDGDCCSENPRVPLEI